MIFNIKTCFHFPGTGSVSSGSAKSVSTQRSELEESLSSSASFPNSPATTAQLPKGRSPVSINGVALQRQRQRDIYRQDLLSLSASTASSYHFRSRSHEALGPSMRTVQVLEIETLIYIFNSLLTFIITKCMYIFSLSLL